jgi:hypothetical protein
MIEQREILISILATTKVEAGAVQAAFGRPDHLGHYCNSGIADDTAAALQAD